MGQLCALLQMYRSSRDIFFLHSPWRKLKQAEGCTGVLLRDLKRCCLAIHVSHTLVQGSEASNLLGHTKAAKSHQETHGTETPGLKCQPRTQSYTLVLQVSQQGLCSPSLPASSTWPCKFKGSSSTPHPLPPTQPRCKHNLRSQEVWVRKGTNTMLWEVLTASLLYQDNLTESTAWSQLR